MAEMHSGLEKILNLGLSHYIIPFIGCHSPSALRLSLAELEPLPCSRATRLLALDSARITGQQPPAPELRTMQRIGQHQRPRDRQPHRTRLARLTAAIHMRLHVKRAERVRGSEGLLDVLHQRRPR